MRGALARGALLALDGYDWPGNVRELENIIERSVALATRPVIGLDDLPLDLAMNEVAPGPRRGEPVPLTLKEARDRFEQAYVLRALEREDWNQSRAARGLGVHRNTLLARLAAWGFRRDEPAISAARWRDRPAERCSVTAAANLVADVTDLRVAAPATRARTWQPRSEPTCA